METTRLRSRFVKKTLLALALGLPAACGKPQPLCSGTTCPAITGEYLFTLTPEVTCPSWQEHTTESAFMSVANTGSSVTVTLWDTSVHPHFFGGTMAVGGSVSLNEPTQNQQLGIPTGSITGTFQPASGAAGPPFQFVGTLSLTDGSSAAGGSTSGGGGSSGGATTCSGSTAIKAVEETTSVTVPDAGTAVDAGTVPDAGNVLDAGTFPDGGGR